MDEYVIPIHGLKEGIHYYNFDIKTGFFEHFDNPDLPGGNLILNLTLQKRSQFFELEFHITGTLDLICDRCLEVFGYKVDINEQLVVRYGTSFEELDDNIIVIPREESRFNIAQYIYEFTVLTIPYKKVHPDKGDSVCDPEMIKKLNELQIKDNRNIITDNSDPRWDKLKNLN